MYSDLQLLRRRSAVGCSGFSLGKAAAAGAGFAKQHANGIRIRIEGRSEVAAAPQIEACGDESLFKSAYG